MIKDYEIIDAKQEFIELISSIEGGNELLTYLETTDFYSAPASLRYHLSEPGGLLLHSLEVCHNMLDMYQSFAFVTRESVIKVGLLHELGKIGFYENYDRNVKKDGQWTQEQSYRVRDASDRIIYGDTAFNSYMIASRYIPFTDDEITAICNYSHINNPGTYIEINNILERSHLTLLLYIADMMAMYNTKYPY